MLPVVVSTTREVFGAPRPRVNVDDGTVALPQVIPSVASARISACPSSVLFNSSSTVAPVSAMGGVSLGLALTDQPRRFFRGGSGVPA